MDKNDSMISDNMDTRYPMLVFEKREEYLDDSVWIYFFPENNAENILSALASKDFPVLTVGEKFSCDFLFSPFKSGRIVQSDKTWIYRREGKTEIQCIAEFDDLSVDGFPPIFAMDHEELFGMGIHDFKECYMKPTKMDLVFSVDGQGCRNVKYVPNHRYKYRCTGYLIVWGYPILDKTEKVR